MTVLLVASLLCTVFWATQATAESVDCSVAPLSLAWSNITVSSNGVAVTRGIELGIGTPNQIFSLRPSTTLNNTRIANVLDCGNQSNTQCIGGKGGVFDSSKSSSFVVSLKNRWNGSAADTEAATGAYVYFNDVIDFQANGTVQGYPLVQNSDLVSGPQGTHPPFWRKEIKKYPVTATPATLPHLTSRVFAGPEAGLPLGQNSSFLAAVTQAKVAPSSVWGLDSGDRSLSPRDGKLVVGGYDASRIAGNLTTFPLGTWTNQQPCPLQVKVTKVQLTIPNGNFGDLLVLPPGSDGVTGCIEPQQQRFTLLPDMTRLFASYAGYDTSYPDLTFSTDDRPIGALEITLDNGYVTTIPNDHLFTPQRGSDSNGQYVVTNASVLETGIAYNVDDADADANVQLILGGLFLTYNYLVVDYDNNQFQMAPILQGDQGSGSKIVAVCKPTVSTTDPKSPLQNQASDTNGTSRTAAIAGGTVGGIVGLAALAAVGYFLARKRKRDRQQREDEQERAQQDLSPTTTYPEPFSDDRRPSELALVCH
ncbi:MAG: hypothetical protein Q9169_003702 [Polycauliona sp. 2 TL-2023]